MNVQELIDNEILVQDPDNEDRVIFNVPLYIKKEVVEAGGFFLFAQEYNKGQNPEAVFDDCIEIVWDFVRETFRNAMLRRARIEAETIASEQINNLLT